MQIVLHTVHHFTVSLGANLCKLLSLYLVVIHSFLFFNINRNTILSSLCTIKDYKVEKIVESLHCDVMVTEVMTNNI